MPYRGNDAWDAVAEALDEWRDGFFDWWRVDPAEDDASWDEKETVKRHEDAAALIQTLCQRAPALYEAMLSQTLPAHLEGALREVSDVPIDVGGLDGRRLHLIPEFDLLFQHIDLALLRDATLHLRSSGTKERHMVFQLLMLTALNSQISPIAGWYFQRAARLLLYGLDTECVAMCRAVLEASLRFALDGEAVRRLTIPRGDPKSREPRLWTLIEAAALLGHFDEKLKDRAHQIRKIGNTALHPGNPEEFDSARRELAPRKRVADLAMILRALFPEDNAKAR